MKLQELTDDEITEQLNLVYATESSAVDPIIWRMALLSIANDPWIEIEENVTEPTTNIGYATEELTIQPLQPHPRPLPDIKEGG